MAIVLMAMSATGHSRRGRAGSRSSHVRSAPKATNSRLRTACREGPIADIVSRLDQVHLAESGHQMSAGVRHWRPVAGGPKTNSDEGPSSNVWDLALTLA